MADIKVARIDFRLIHGQVITKWIKYYPVDMIVIVDDILVQDEFMAEIYKMAVPKGIKFKIFSSEEAKDQLEKLDEKVFLLFKDIETCVKTVSRGLKMEFLVVGGVPGEEGRKFISDGISLRKEEFEQLEQLQNDIDEIIFKSIPEESQVTMKKAKEKFE
jgi:D-glucosaminate-specific PTS system IIB component